jgi:LuxR family maltose regulon positive regulatory protein
MHPKIPRVENGRLFQSESEGDSILVGTHAWHDWLEQQSAFTFADHALIYTARKSEQRTGGSSWQAFRRHQGKLYRIILGPSHALTLERLQAAAQAFAREPVPDEQASTPSRQQGRTRLTRPASAHSALAVDQNPSFIQTKHYRPRASSDLIPRPHLLERMTAGLGRKVTLVCAPAGFGKTTLLVTWIETLDRPTVWLSLDEGDDDLDLFVRSLTAALQSILPDAFGSVASLLQTTRFPALNTLIALLCNDLADVAEDLLLVLDDCHRLHSSEVHRLLDQLVEHMPAQVHLVLSSRSDPQLPLARWLALGYLHELRASDLRFTREETEAFLVRELGSGAAPEVVGALEARTEGWIAVLRLAALSLRTAPDPKAFLQRLGQAAERTISRYLVEEVLGQLEPDMQEVLERVSILEQFCTPLCRAIMGSAGSNAQVQAALEWLERSHLFLVPLDERQSWYRLHHLFQGLLQQRLQERLSQQEMALLHRRASAWYAQQGLLEESLEHALAAGDGAGATRLVEAYFWRAYKQEQWVQLERWLRLLPEQEVQASPVLLIARAWIAQARGSVSDIPPLLTAAEQLLESNNSGASEPGERQSRLLRALSKIYWSEFMYDTGQAQASWQNARSALELTPPGEEYVKSMALLYLANSSRFTGQADAVLAQLQQVLRAQSTDLGGTARLLFAQGMLYLQLGKLHQMEHVVRHLLQIAQEDDLVLSQYWAHFMLGIVYYEWNRLDAAVYHFSAILANQYVANFSAVWDSMCGLALAYQARGLGTQAQEPARALLAVMQEQRNMGRLMEVYAFLGRLALLQNKVEEASRWLEMAGEQEVWGQIVYYLDDSPITRAQLLLVKGDEVSVAEGQALLTHLLQIVETRHNIPKKIQVLALQAWAYDLQGRKSEALEVLEYALALGRPGGFVRTFTDLAPLATLLHELRKKGKERHEIDLNVDTYLQSILASMSPASAHVVSPKELMRQEGLEPLTERELQTLHLLEKGLTNREIANELVVTSGTVKLHTKHIYRKLSVNNRQAAIILARGLGLLAAT